ncbi:MAG TPA: hypothetical protein VKB18_06910 [Gemmatimonadota bacterium]|nr:hypothetical protein [Gemmatimonadota bacterium]
MECEAAREAMMECEPAELEGGGDGPLAAHLGTCEACRRRARTLAAELRALDAALEAMSGRSADRTPAAAREHDVPRGMAAGMAGAGRWERGWRLAAPVAVAAAIAVLVLAWPNGRPAGPVDRGPAAAAGGAEPGSGRAPAPGQSATRGRLRVRVPDDRRVAVFQTRDPSVAVVWFFPKTNGG